MSRFKPVKITALVFAAFGALAGLAAINGRGAVEMGAVHFSGLNGIAAMMVLFALIGAALGLIIMILMRALSLAARGDRRKR